MKKAIVLLSGGLDSTVCLWWAKAQGFRCYALSFDYGQRHVKEMRAARRVARKASVPHSVGRFSLPWSASSLTSRSARLPSHSLEKMSAKIPSTYVPARNTIFLSFALSWADQENADALVIGANAVDYSGYPDCRPEYLRAFETVARRGTKNGTEGGKRIRILAPLVRLTKADIVRWGRKLGAPLEMTWSCYRGDKNPCGQCDSCKLRAKGFEEAEKNETRVR